MPQQTTVTAPAQAWVQLTNGDATNVTFQNLGPSAVYIVPTTSDTAPTDRSGALLYPPQMGEINQAIADIWPGQSSGVRLYAQAAFSHAEVTISHA